MTEEQRIALIEFISYLTVEDWPGVALTLVRYQPIEFGFGSVVSSSSNLLQRFDPWNLHFRKQASKHAFFSQHAHAHPPPSAPQVHLALFPEGTCTVYPFFNMTKA